MVGDWLRTTRNLRCAVCGSDHWCLIHKNRDAAICPRVSEGSVKDLGDAGYLHLFGPRQPKERYSFPRFEPRVPARAIEAPPPDWSAIIKEYRERITNEAKHLASGILGVSENSLDRLGIGLTPKNVWSFVMKNPKGEPCGIRVRNTQGKKWAYPGSRNGLFIPDGLNGVDPLLICEGPTDVAAALDFGFEAIGRPNCNGAMEWCLEMGRKRDVILFADNDGPGLGGANKLAEWMVRQAKSCRVVVAPYNKDLRDWKRDGATRLALKAVIDNASHWNN